jgi:cell wall-associated NlpC family hydrolase
MADDRTVQAILEVTRRNESGGDYAAEAGGSTASGAYQFIDSTWRSVATSSGVPGATEYAHAADAPAEIQDAVAAWHVREILDQHGGNVDAVFAVWYVGHYDPAELDYVPSPGAGNRATVRDLIETRASQVDEMLGMPATPPVDTPSEQPGGHTALDTFLDAATSQAGDSYVFGAEADLGDADPEVFDCSELVQWAAGRAGVTMPDGSWYQYLHLQEAGTTMSVEQALNTPGALLFSFSSEPTAGGGRPSQAHVAISLGDGHTLIEARGRAYGVGEFSADGRTFTHAASIQELGTELSVTPVTATLPVGVDADSDTDGILDVFEQMVGTDPFSPDTDRDGFLDFVELTEHRTDPLDFADNAMVASTGIVPTYRPPLTTSLRPPATVAAGPGVVGSSAPVHATRPTGEGPAEPTVTVVEPADSPVPAEPTVTVVEPTDTPAPAEPEPAPIAASTEETVTDVVDGATESEPAPDVDLDADPPLPIEPAEQPTTPVLGEHGIDAGGAPAPALATIDSLAHPGELSVGPHAHSGSFDVDPDVAADPFHDH